jgi:hypothetical protein
MCGFVSLRCPSILAPDTVSLIHDNRRRAFGTFMPVEEENVATKSRIDYS